MKKMTQKKLRELLNGIGIHNNHNLLENGEPQIHYRSPGYRDVTTKAYMVYVKGKSFKDAPFYDYGCKSFHVWGKDDKKKKLKEAMDFIKSLFPDVELVRSPFGGWIPKKSLDRVKELVQSENN